MFLDIRKIEEKNIKKELLMFSNPYQTTKNSVVLSPTINNAKNERTILETSTSKI